MSDRTSSMKLTEKAGIIPEERWETFCKHIRSLGECLPGHVTVTSEAVKYEREESETLYFPRNTESPYPGSNYYIIHSQGQSFYPAEVAAFFLLFRQDCLDSNPKCSLDGDYDAVRTALNNLKAANLWTGEAPKCLLCPEDVEKEFREARYAANEALKKAWGESETPDRIHIRSSMDKAVLDIMPLHIKDVMDESDWLDYVYRKSRIEERNAGKVEIKENGETKTRWFRTFQEGRIFAHDEAARLGLLDDSPNIEKLQAGNLGVSVAPVPFSCLPLDPEMERMRQDEFTEDNDGCSPCP